MPEANSHAFGVVEQAGDGARWIPLAERAQLPQIRQQLAEHLEGDVMPMRELEQATDGFQILNAATERIHAQTKTRLEN